MGEKSEFETLRKNLGVPFKTVHLDEQSDDLAKFTAGKTPCVAGKLKEGTWVMLLGDEELKSCHKDVGTFDTKLKSAIVREGSKVGKKDG